MLKQSYEVLSMCPDDEGAELCPNYCSRSKRHFLTTIAIYGGTRCRARADARREDNGASIAGQKGAREIDVDALEPTG